MTDGDTMEIQVDQQGDVVVVRPQGDIDIGRAPSFRVKLREAQRQRPSRLIVDLAAVPYMDSSGVATLVEAMQMARKSGTRLVLCALQTKVMSIFEIARLDTVFVIAPSMPEAMTT
jgi:anti-sigma B factor antagonist